MVRSAEAGPGPDDLGILRRISRTDRRILAVSSATVASRFLGKLAQLAFIVIAARLLSVEEFAGYSYLIVLALTFSMLADTGVALAASREISAGRRTPAEAFWSSLPVIFAGGLIGGAVALSFGVFDSAPGSSGAALIVTCLFVVTNTLFNFAATTLRGVGRSVYEAVVQGVGAIVFVTAAAVALALGGDLLTVLAILLAKEVLSLLVALVGLWPHVRPVQRAAAEAWRLLLRIGLQLGVASTALALVTRVPTLVLANDGSAEALAWFSAGQRLADAVLVLATTSGFAVLPSLTLLLTDERERGWRLLRRLLWGALAAGVLIGAVSVLFADQIVTAAFGSDFSEAVQPTRVLMAATPAYAVVGLAWYALVALDRERALLVVAGLTALLALALSLLLVPDGDDVGAAIAYAGSLAAMAAGLLALLAGTRAGARP